MEAPTEEQLPQIIDPAEASEISWLTIAVTIIALIVAQQIIQRVIDRIVERSLKSHKYTTPKERRKRRETLSGFFSTLSIILLAIIGIIIILHQLGVNWAALIAGFGTIGVLLGITGQNLIKDFLTGSSIIMYDQYRVGDIVTIADRAGVVETLSLRFTRLRDLDGNVHVIPNSIVDVVTNHSLGYSAVNLNIPVTYDSDIDKIAKIINDLGAAMAKEEKWESIITEPISFLRVDNFGVSSVDVKALGRVVPGEQWTVAGEFRKRIKSAFQKEGIEVPYQQVIIRNQPKRR